MMKTGMPNFVAAIPLPEIGTPALSTHPVPVGTDVTVSVVPALDAVKLEHPALLQLAPEVTPVQLTFVIGRFVREIVPCPVAWIT